MASLHWIEEVNPVDDSHMAVIDWIGAHAVYRMSSEERASYELALSNGGSVDSTRPPREVVIEGTDAFNMTLAAWQRAEDQTSPLGEVWQENSTGVLSVHRRWRYTCPITGKSWVCLEKSYHDI